MLEGLLNAGHEAVRANAFRFGEKLCKLGSGQGHLHLLEMLHDLREADRRPHHCSEYYRLLTEIVRTVPQVPGQVGSSSPQPHLGSIRRSSGFDHTGRVPYSWPRRSKI